MRQTISEKKKYLKRYEILNYQYERLISKAIEWREKVNGVSAVNPYNMGIKGSGYINPLDLFIDNQDKCLREALEIKKQIEVIEEAINNIDEPILASVLSLYYIDNMDIYDISKELGYSTSYIRHAHVKALEKFEIPKDG